MSVMSDLEQYLYRSGGRLRKERCFDGAPLLHVLTMFAICKPMSNTSELVDTMLMHGSIVFGIQSAP